MSELQHLFLILCLSGRFYESQTGGPTVYKKAMSRLDSEEPQVLPFVLENFCPSAAASAN